METFNNRLEVKYYNVIRLDYSNSSRLTIRRVMHSTTQKSTNFENILNRSVWAWNSSKSQSGVITR